MSKKSKQNIAGSMLFIPYTGQAAYLQMCLNALGVLRASVVSAGVDYDPVKFPQEYDGEVQKALAFYKDNLRIAYDEAVRIGREYHD